MKRSQHINCVFLQDPDYHLQIVRHASHMGAIGTFLQWSPFTTRRIFEARYWRTPFRAEYVHTCLRMWTELRKISEWLQCFRSHQAKAKKKQAKETNEKFQTSKKKFSFSSASARCELALIGFIQTMDLVSFPESAVLCQMWFRTDSTDTMNRVIRVLYQIYLIRWIFLILLEPVSHWQLALWCNGYDTWLMISRLGIKTSQRSF